MSNTTRTDARTRSSTITVSQSAQQITENYCSRMYSPLCGLVTSVGYSLRSRLGPRVSIAGGELTGVHVLLGQEPPKSGSYHIGGSGIVPFESGIKTYGESAERYAGSLAVLDPELPRLFASYDDMVSTGRNVLDQSRLRLIDAERVRTTLYPFHVFDARSPMTWVEIENIGKNAGRQWIPAQQFLVGYPVRLHEGERWLAAAVSTGTAVHTSYDKAILASAYELIQIDAAMGHWYGRLAGVRITLDNRTRRLERILKSNMPVGGYEVEFHYLPSADLPGFTVACILREPQGRVPVVSVGLGADSRLENAMYKAWLEGVGVRSLAEWSLVNAHLEAGTVKQDVEAMFDLDSNVVHAAQPDGAQVVEERFGQSSQAAASDLPADSNLGAHDEARRAVRAFLETDKDLFLHDFTTQDVRSLGFRAVRLWSPDTFSLCLPSAPPEAHLRFNSYGGFGQPNPHPYP